MAWYNSLPVVGGWFDNPEQEALTQRFNDMASAYGDYRHLHADARQAQLGTQLSALGPMQQYLSLMMPGLRPFDYEGMKAQFGNTTDAIKNNQTPGVTGGGGPAALMRGGR